MMPKQVLLDENLPLKLRHHLAGHIVITTQYQGWSGKRNGDLIALAENEGFDVFVTQDQNLGYQQNLHGRKMALIVIILRGWKIALDKVIEPRRRNNQEQIILANSELILAAIDAAKVSDYIEVIVEPPKS